MVWDAELFFKFNLSARQQIFSGSGFAFWNRPCAVILALKEWTARMYEQHF
jgi:hypothetical protein